MMKQKTCTVLCIVNVFMSGSPIFLMPIQLRRACSAGQGLRKMIAPAVHTLLPVIDVLYSFCPTQESCNCLCQASQVFCE